MPDSCVCVGCTNRRTKGKRISFHGFPFEDTDVLAAWLKNINRTSDFKPSSYDRVCSEHFLAEDYVHNIHPREESYILKHVLKVKAIPTVFPVQPKHKRRQSTRKRKAILKHGNSTKRIAQDSTKSEVQLEHTHSDTVPAEESLVDTKVKLRKKQAGNRVLNQNLIRQVIKIETVLQNMLQRKFLSQEQADSLDLNFGSGTRVLIENELQCLSSSSASDHRYSEDVKKFAVTVHLYSPRAYNFIRAQLHLPDKATIRKWCSSINCQPGVLTEAVESLKERVQQKNITRHCTLMMDAMAIKKEVVFNDKTKSYEGFVDCGRIEATSSESLATEALVFMVVGLAEHYKLPVAYYMVDYLPVEVQAEMISQLLHILHNAGMTVHAVVCDGSYPNQATAKILGCSLYPELMRPYFQNPASPEDRVYFVFDTCHMLKLVRNCFASCGKLYHGHNVIDWDYIKWLHELQENDTIRLEPKLKFKHVQWQHHKMNITLAVQTLSLSVADAIDFLREDLNHPQFAGSEETCNFIRKVNKLVDLMNSKNPTAKAFKQPFKSENLASRKRWLLEMVRYFEMMKDNQHNRLCTSKKKIPFVGFVATILSVLEVCKKLLQQDDLTNLYTYRLSQDHLKVFFNRVRHHSGQYNNPNTLQFRLALRTILKNSNIKSSWNANAVQAPQEPSNFLFKQIDSKTAIQLDKSMVKYFEHLSSKSEYHDNVLHYISGYITRILIKDCSCTQCIIALQHGSSAACPSGEHTDWKDRGGLLKPRPDVFYIVQAADRAYTELMCGHGSLKYIKSSNFCKRIEIKVLELVIGFVFYDLHEHRKDCDLASENDHIYQLVKAITSLFLTFMLHHQSQVLKEQFVFKNSVSERHKLNKTILFLPH